MIHVCRVDVGSRHVFDSADGIDNVESLSNAIQSVFRIQKSNQIMLISGGEVLDNAQQKLYCLSAGREESPIYLIDKQNVERQEPPFMENELDNLTQDASVDIDRAILLKPCFQTVESRSNLVNQIYQRGKELHNKCRSFYDDQYWQYQGFLALIANLDEFMSSMRKNEESIKDQFELFASKKPTYKQLMIDMDKVIKLLDRTSLLPQVLVQNPSNKSQTNTPNSNRNPLSPTLSNDANSATSSSSASKVSTPTTNLFSSFSSQSICNLTQSPSSTVATLDSHGNTIRKLQKQIDTYDESASPKQDDVTMNSVLVFNESNMSHLSLLDWIKSFDPQHQLDNVIAETREMFSNFEKNFKWTDLLTRKAELLSKIENNQKMREIEGLTKRLQDLNMLLESSKRLLDSQFEIANGFSLNKERADKLKDESILKDLCRGHEGQLKIFKTNHLKLIEITRRVNNAKLELIRVIHSRLNWVMEIQNQMAEINFQIQINFKQLRRLSVRLKLMEQLKRVPKIYICSLRETIRRQRFSAIYKEFANEINALIKRIYEKETKQRENFEKEISSASQHFIINILFGGLSDKVETVLNESSLKFDKNLPKLEDSDVDLIENQIKSQLNLLFTRSQANVSSPTISTTTTTNTATLSPATSPSSSSASSSTAENDQNAQDSANAESTSDGNVASTVVDSRDERCDYEKEIFDSLFKERSSKDQDFELIKKLLKYIRKHQDRLLNQIEEESSSSTTKQNDEVVSSNESLSLSFIKLPRKTQKILNEAVMGLKQDLSETRDIMSSYKEKTSENFKMIIEMQKSESEKFSSCVANELAKREALENERKTKLYENVLECLKKPMNEINQSAIDGDEVDVKFFNELRSIISNNDAESRFIRNKQKEDIKIKELNDKVKELEAEINKLKCLHTTDQQKLIAIESKSTSSKEFKPSDSSTQLAMVSENDSNQDKSQMNSKLIRLHSCQIDDLVIAVYSEEYEAYKIIHKSSTYLHFVHWAILKSNEKRLSFNNSNNSRVLANTSIPSSFSSNQLQQTQHQRVGENFELINPVNNQAGQDGPPSKSDNNQPTATNTTTTTIVKNSPLDNVDNIFLSEKKPQWFIGRVVDKPQLCEAKKVNNRFKVPNGTRFYRVKLEPYNIY